MMSGDKFTITEDEYRKIVSSTGKVGISSLSVTINTTSIENIKPEVLEINSTSCS